MGAQIYLHEISFQRQQKQGDCFEMWPPTGSHVSENGLSRLPNFRHGVAKGAATQLMQFCSAMELQELERLLFGNNFSSPYAHFWLTLNGKSSLAIDRLCDETAGGNIGVVCTATTSAPVVEVLDCPAHGPIFSDSKTLSAGLRRPSGENISLGGVPVTDTEMFK